VVSVNWQPLVGPLTTRIFAALQRKSGLDRLTFKWHWEPTDHCLVAVVSEPAVRADDKKFLCSVHSNAFDGLFWWRTHNAFFHQRPAHLG